MIDLDELMRLHDAATPGPWKIGAWDNIIAVSPCGVEWDKALFSVALNAEKTAKADAEYICAACNAAPELVARIRELEEYKASVYAAMCNESLDVDGVCPMSGMACPFEKKCEDITTDEWLAVWRKNA